MNANGYKIAAKANLRWADLRGADLRGADLSWADLSGADLSEANLRGADLRGADLRGTNLSEADLSWANLRGADLRGTNLSEADLSGANLRTANLRGANLSEANLSEANLSEANLRGADLRGATLSWADLRGADLHEAKNVPLLPETIIVPEGTLRVYKKVSNGIAVLQIPEHALRSNATTRKCRASEAIVLECPSGAHSKHDPTFKYNVGETIRPIGAEFDTNRWNECAPGIHFFLTRAEAEAY